MRRHILLKIFSFVFALHILNISVDPPDTDPDWISEDLSSNEMESITEIIFEKILHIENAFPEHDEHDNGDKGSPVGLHVSLSFAFWRQPVFSLTPFRTFNRLYVAQNEKIFHQYTEETLTPPPKA